ncbi:MAG TPA: ABC transporter ATP-binding protein [Candidatus Dormibacteraeota bacterium]|nr:ABC transporter ATP-binding protein [Candidatus Dormibacteraeota bacterium]
MVAGAGIVSGSEGRATLLRCEQLDRWFGGVHAVDHVDLEVAAGSLHAIIGPNGSGKTTLFNLITGHTSPHGGRVWFADRDVTGLPYHRMVRLGVAKSYQVTTVFQSLSVFENVRIAAQSARWPYTFWLPASRLRDASRLAEETLERVGLQDRRAELAGNLSHGELRHLDLAIALATRPRLLLLDEPTAGMSPTETEATVQLIQSLRRDLTVVLIEHKMDVVLRIAERITVLNFGVKLFEGTPEEVRGHPRVQEVYLQGAL